MGKKWKFKIIEEDNKKIVLRQKENGGHEKTWTKNERIHKSIKQTKGNIN